MKKLITLLLTVLIWLGTLAQTYTSSTLEVMNYKTSQVVSTTSIDFQFVLDTASKVLTVLDKETGTTQVFLLLKKSPVVLRSEHLKIWGYIEIKTNGNTQHISFTETLEGQLISINFYDPVDKVGVFYVDLPRKTNL